MNNDLQDVLTLFEKILVPPDGSELAVYALYHVMNLTKGGEVGDFRLP
jgi:hypothetical protein